MSGENAQKIEKRGPGRPRKNVPSEKVVIEGIIQKPKEADDYVELFCSSPLTFKKLFTICKQYNSSDLDLYFLHDKVVIETSDHNKLNKIQVEIYGANLDVYYCKFPIRATVKLADLEMVMSHINKDQYKIIFIMRDNYKSAMRIILCSEENTSLREYSIELTAGTCSEEELARLSGRSLLTFEHHDYKVYFKLSSKSFKNIITAAKKSKTITFQIVHDSFLQIQTDSSQPTHFSEIFRSNDKISLTNRLEKNEIIAVNCKFLDIKPFASSNITDERLEFALARSKPIVITAHIPREKQKKKGEELLDKTKVLCSIRILISQDML